MREEEVHVEFWSLLVRWFRFIDLYHRTTFREASNMYEEELHIKQYWSWCVRRFGFFDYHYDATRL